MELYREYHILSMMTEPPSSMSGDEICAVCGKPRKDHSSKETLDCSLELIEMGLKRYCGLCGLTKPASGTHDRCGKCGEKYSFSKH